MSKETFRNGIQGHVHDLKLLFTQPWGFELEDITSNVQVWHGDEDKSVPLAHGQHIAEQIPNCELHVISGAGHAPMPDTFSKILKAFQASAK